MLVWAPFQSLNSASKFALEGLSKSLAPVLRKAYNIRVSILEPSAVSAPSLVEARSSRAFLDNLCAGWGQVPKDLFLDYFQKDLGPAMHASCTPEEVAQLLEDIVSSQDPHLRYQTNDKAAVKLVDPTGNSILKFFQAMQ
ncbi:estradiol 17-beta-dehydrogenase 1-like [Acanthaster planci]|uniref:Estradiol 17-beta-dehydrogenase 1-like n=1 Tax=Acanthaster planci TaxID=133434 RepID=A0A8B7Z0I0_ACAPL|nr:estradiol 17-beta-dehydrogenase 1-like [Acanthaster planci]